MKLPGINYNWNVTSFAKQDVNAPLAMANAKSQMAGAVASAAGSGAQVAQAFKTADDRKKKEAEEFRQVQAQQDLENSNDARKFAWDQAAKDMADGDYNWQLENAGVTHYSASDIGEGVIPENAETKSFAENGEVYEVENDQIPAWKVQPDMYKRDTLASRDIAAEKITDWEDKRAFIESSDNQINATYLKMTIAAKAEAKAYMVSKSEADINEAQDQGRFNFAEEQIKAYPGGEVEQQKLMEDNQTKSEKWLYQDAINVRSYDNMATFLRRLQSNDYQEEFGGLNQDERSAYINTYIRLLDDKKRQIASDAKFDMSKMQFDVDQTIESLTAGRFVNPEIIAKSRAQTVTMKDEKRFAKLNSVDKMQNDFLQAAHLPTKYNTEIAENIRNQASEPVDINSADDLKKLIDKSNAEREENVMDWKDGISPNKLPAIRQDENEADDIRVRADLANKLRQETGVYTGFYKANEVTSEADKLNAMNAGSRYKRAIFMQDTIPNDIRGYTNQLMKNGAGGSYPIALNLISDGKSSLAKEVLEGEEIRKANKDIGTNYKSNANLEFSQFTGNAYDGTPTERGRVYEASLDLMAARSSGADAGTWDSAKYKQIVMELSDGIVEMDGNNFVRKPSATLPDRDFMGWVNTMDYSEIDKLALNQKVDLPISSKKIVKGVRNGDYTLKGPYNGGYLLYDVKGDRLLSDSKNAQLPFILSYDSKYITEAEAGRAREAEAMKSMPKPQRKAVKTYRERQEATVGGNLDIYKTEEERNKPAPKAGPFKF